MWYWARGHAVAHVVGRRVGVRVGMDRRELAEAKPVDLHLLPLLVDHASRSPGGSAGSGSTRGSSRSRSSSWPGSRRRRGGGSEASPRRARSPRPPRAGRRAPRPGRARPCPGSTNTNGPQVSTCDRHQAEALHVEVRLLLAARRRAQAAVEPVGPGVVGALDRAAALRLVHEHGAAVAADVQERAQRVLAVAHHQQRQPAHAAWGTCCRARRARRGAPRTASERRKIRSRSTAAISGSAYQLYGKRLRARLDLRATHGRVILSKSICESNFRRMRTRARWARSPAGLDILELFAGGSPELTQTEISERLGLPVPTVHRLVKLLTRARLAGARRREPQAAARARRRAAAARPCACPTWRASPLRAMAERAGETVNLATLRRRRGPLSGERDRHAPAHAPLARRTAAPGARDRARQVPAGATRRRRRARARPGAGPIRPSPRRR